MRKCRWPIAFAALIASPAPGQTIGGPNSMSPIPGTSLPDSSASDVDKAVRAIGEERAGSAEKARRREESPAFRENLRIRRRQAEQYAAAARSGVPLPGDAAATLRNELRADIEQWRAEFGVSRKEAQAMREQWLVERGSLSAAQWAERRVDWWRARDAWIARNRPQASAAPL